VENNKVLNGLFFSIKEKVLKKYFMIIGDVYMKSAVLYFSRSGNSKRVAEKIADRLGVKSIEITDNKSWGGVLGWIKAGYYASFDKSVDIKVNGSIEGIEQFIVVSPTWAGGPALAVRQLLKKIGSDKAYLVMTSDGSDFKNSLEKYEGKIGKLKGYFGIIKRLKNEEVIIEEIIRTVK
jgi:flavodoxin